MCDTVEIAMCARTKVEGLELESPPHPHLFYLINTFTPSCRYRSGLKIKTFSPNSPNRY